MRVSLYSSDKYTPITSALGMAIRAQLHSLHPRLVPEDKKDDFQPDQEDIANSTADELNHKYTAEDPNAAEKRRNWLVELNEWTPDVFDESPHVIALTGFLAYMVDKCPESKLVVMSQYLKYLDIVDLLMLKRYKVKCLRYDGTVGQAQRVLVQKEFSRVDMPRPLLMTAGAGSVGLNLTSGKVVVLAEEWWNYSTEAQAIFRCWRQGAVGEVNVVKFHVKNSAMDAEITRVRQSKVRTNEALMKPLIHKHDEVPEPVELLY